MPVIQSRQKSNEAVPRNIVGLSSEEECEMHLDGCVERLSDFDADEVQNLSEEDVDSNNVDKKNVDLATMNYM